MLEDYVEKRRMPPRQESSKLYPAPGAYGSQYCSMTVPLCSILHCLPPGGPVLLAPSMQNKIFIDKITDDIYTYDQDNKLFNSAGDLNQNTAADLQQVLKDKNQNWLKVTTLGWACQAPINSVMLCTE